MLLHYTSLCLPDTTLTTETGNQWSTNCIYYGVQENGNWYTTNLVGCYTFNNLGRTISYTYDGSGNIATRTDNKGGTSLTAQYIYDELNQLIRENDPVAGKTTTYTYDNGGNILTKTEYAYTTGALGTPTNTIDCTYGNTEWKDLLTAYNGQNITYDQIGNPLTYYNGTQFTWNYGRKLATATTADGTSVSYKYNDGGIRTQKTVNGVTTDYFLDGSKIVAQKTGNNTTWYYYDGDGTREAIEYGGNVYYYFYNAQGDVVGLFDNNLNVVVEYTYDSWGNVLSITGSLANTLGQDNPFRYRGYYFDSDTGLYYLNSRYYDANTGRFVNADVVVSGSTSIQGYNLFVYCFNNPVNLSDEDGNWPKWVEKAASAVKNVINKVISHVKSNTSLLNNIQFSKKATNRPDSGLAGLPDEEIQRRARDKSLSGKERNRYREEEKVRGLRNKQKRQSNITPEQIGQVACGVATISVAVVGITYVVANDFTGIGTADDILIATLITLFNQGTLLIFQTS